MLFATTFYPSPSVLNIWTSLLAHLQSLHPTLPAILTSKIISRLGAPIEPNAAVQNPDADIVLLDADEEREKQRQDASYDRCVAGWAHWLVDTYSRRDDEDEDDEGDTPIDRTDVVLKLVSALGPTKSVSGTREKTSVPSHRATSPSTEFYLHTQCAGPFARSEQGPAGTRESVCARTEHAAAHIVWGTSARTVYFPPLTPTRTAFPQTWQEADMQLMHDRLTALLNASGRASSSSASISTPPETAMADAGHGVGDRVDAPSSVPRLPTGWRRVSREDGWRPSPIGVFVPCAAG